MSQSAKLQAYLRENARWIQAESYSVPPFTLFFHASDKGERANYAIPDTPVAQDVREALRQIASICANRECKAHIRFLRAFAPELPALLQASGYDQFESWPLMVCTPKTFLPAKPIADLEMVTIFQDSPLEEIKEGMDANALGFDLMANLVSDEEAEAFRPMLVGALAFTARLQGQAVGAGMYNPIRNSVTELVGVATLAPYRRRGIASFLGAFATQAAFAHGAEMVFLIPENAEAQRVYERIGYTFYTDLLRYHAKA
jgi:GNAT superfamily N-acetyltransferase